MAENESDKVFVEITNREIYDLIFKLEKKFDVVINGNGKKGIKEVLSNLCLAVKIHHVILLALMVAAIKSLFF